MKEGNIVIEMKKLPHKILLKAKQYGFSDRQIAYLCKTDELTVRQSRKERGIEPVFKTVDTCAAEFEAHTPYHYSTYETEDEFKDSGKKKVIILGGGPNRIGQGIEFDYCCVHGIFALQEEGYEAIMINCNPETVSTDYDVADKLYFEPLTLEDVLTIHEKEKPMGVIVSFGGQTPLKLAKALEANGVRILGTSPDDIDLAEDRKRFGELLQRLHIPHPDDGTASNFEEAKRVAARIGYPVLVRPSYVLGGRAMEIVYTQEALEEYMPRAVKVSPEHPILIDKFLEDAKEFDIDAVCDGEDVLIGGVMEHIEEAGVHSGDSACILMPVLDSPAIIEQLKDFTKKLALALKVRGLVNVQCAVKGGIVYVLEVNPRASRTVPFVSKATGIPLVKIATKVMIGRKLRAFGIRAVNNLNHIAVKQPVFPFGKFPKARLFLGPEMRSTGEVMGLSETYGEAIAKAFLGAGISLPLSGGVFISVNDNDKNYKTLEIARMLMSLGFKLYATRGTSQFLSQNGLPNTLVYKVNESRPNIVDYIKNGEIHLVINTPLGETSRFDEISIGRSALEASIPVLTNLSAAYEAVRGIRWIKEKQLQVKSLQEYHAV